LVNKNVLSCLLKDSREVDAVTLVGRLFHVCATVTRNDRSPMVQHSTNTWYGRNWYRTPVIQLQPMTLRMLIHKYIYVVVPIRCFLNISTLLATTAVWLCEFQLFMTCSENKGRWTSLLVFQFVSSGMSTMCQLEQRFTRRLSEAFIHLV